jgi:hypothetical protein
MKHLLNISASNKAGIIPIFVELRSVKFAKDESLETVIYRELVSAGGSESESLYTACLREGVFCIFLDGFDEIHPDTISLAIEQIEQFSRKFQRASIVVSTRPGTGLHSLSDFDVYHVNPLTKAQAISVVRKTPFDKEAKNNFIRALEDRLYEEHKTMMSIPILVIMMLLTFRSYGDIPDRMTVFYGQAFDTLFSIHDTESKLQYRRVHSSGLAPDQFKHVLESFCFRSLSNHDLEFTLDSLDAYLSESIRFEQVNCKPEDYRSDLVKNVCVLQPDGINFVFVHRSFQEYFAARFALRYSGKNQTSVIDKIIKGRGGSVARMLDEMNRPKFYRAWLLPQLQGTLDFFESLAEAPKWKKLSVAFSDVSFSEVRLASGAWGASSDLHHLLTVYAEVTAKRIGINLFVHKLQLKIPRGKEALVPRVALPDDQGIRFNIAAKEANEEIVGFTNIDEIHEALIRLLREEIARVQAFVDEQARMEDDLLA